MRFESQINAASLIAVVAASPVPAATTCVSRALDASKASFQSPANSDSSVNAQPPPSEYTRKRQERTFSCESMRALDRDLRITGASKKGASWQYHIEVLDTRARLPSFMDPGSLPSPTTTTGAHANDSANSPLAHRRRSSVGDAAYSDLPPLVRYSVMRRYNDFRQLYVYLADTYGADVLESLPKFPDGGLLSYLRGDDPRLLKYRREQLQRFLRALDEHPHLKWCRGLTHFLRPDLHELTTVGGIFQTHADVADAPSYGREDGSSVGFVPQPPTSSSSGYVSLSMVKSPEIRFSHQVSGDRKRRRGPFAFWGSSAEPEGRPSSAAAALTGSRTPVTVAATETGDTGGSTEKRASLTEEEENDEEDDEAGASACELEVVGAEQQQQQKAATRLLRLLSLEQ